jgi:hypothetical protein
MGGSPLFRVILVVMALLVLLAPLRMLTGRPHEPATPVTQAAPDAKAKKKFRMELTSTTVPFKYQITSAGENIWSGETNSTTVVTERELRFPPEGIDLVLYASWNEEKPTAVRLMLKPEGSDTMAKTVWGTTSVSEVLTFKEEE